MLLDEIIFGEELQPLDILALEIRDTIEEERKRVRDFYDGAYRQFIEGANWK